MDIATARKECERLYTLGFIAIPTISVFARDDAHHVWCVRQLGFFTPPVEATVSEPVFENPLMKCEPCKELDEKDLPNLIQCQSCKFDMVPHPIFNDMWCSDCDSESDREYFVF